MYPSYRIFVLLTWPHERMTLQEPLSTMVGIWPEVFVVCISPTYGFVSIRPYGSLNARCKEDVLKLLAHKKTEKISKWISREHSSTPPWISPKKVWHHESHIYRQVSRTKQPDSSWLAVGWTQQRLWNAGVVNCQILVRRESSGKWTWPAEHSTIVQENASTLHGGLSIDESFEQSLWFYPGKFGPQIFFSTFIWSTSRQRMITIRIATKQIGVLNNAPLFQDVPGLYQVSKSLHAISDPFFN